MDIISFILGYKKGIASGGGGSTGGGSLPTGLYLRELAQIPSQDTSESFYPFVLSNELFVLSVGGSLSSKFILYKYTGGTFVEQNRWALSEFIFDDYTMLASSTKSVEYDGKVYFISTYTSPYPFYSFDGSTFELLGTIPEKYSTSSIFVADNTLYCDGSNALYKWNGTGWLKANQGLGSSYIYFSVNEDVYACKYKSNPVYKFDKSTGAFATLYDKPGDGTINPPKIRVEKDGFMYFINTGGTASKYAELYKYDVTSNALSLLGRCPHPYTNPPEYWCLYNNEFITISKGAVFASAVNIVE